MVDVVAEVQCVQLFLMLFVLLNGEELSHNSDYLLVFSHC